MTKPGKFVLSGRDARGGSAAAELGSAWTGRRSVPTHRDPSPQKNRWLGRAQVAVIDGAGVAEVSGDFTSGVDAVTEGALTEGGAGAGRVEGCDPSILAADVAMIDGAGVGEIADDSEPGVEVVSVGALTVAGAGAGRVEGSDGAVGEAEVAVMNAAGIEVEANDVAGRVEGAGDCSLTDAGTGAG